ncbi:MAG: arginine repressor [Candidatus Latescibacteria bacterium]|nr:arginine repressor [Candidatus Latescibacterota bacterium]
MDTKKLRHKKIVEIVEQQVMETQEELVNLLTQLGITVSQSTLSKDIKQLGLVKTRNVDGSARYSLPVERATPQNMKILQRELSDYLLRHDNAQNLLILRTTPGNAQGVCAAIDNMNWPEILGTVAGEDTVLIISKTVKETKAVMAKIHEITGM